ncbi:MAG: hypothetical protein PUD03_00565 [Lachnospiraceae bacterium]|nr:hypothetical protein [Lachnospiraceae bacterium]
MFGSFLEGRPVNDRLRRNDNTLDLKAAKVRLIAQHTIHRAGADHLRASLANNAVIREELLQFLRGSSSDVQLEGFTHDGSLLLVYDDVPVLVPGVADREAEGPLALLCCLSDPSADLLLQVGAVVLGQTFQHALQDNALRSFRDSLLSVEQLHACLLQFMFIDRNISAISAEAVNLPHDDALKAVLLRVFDHLQKFHTTRRAFSRDMTVSI